MDSAIPVVMRGAGRDLDLPREVWTVENIRRRFGDVEVSLGHIPYADQFDSAYNPKVKTTATMRDFLNTFSESGELTLAEAIVFYLAFLRLGVQVFGT